MEKKDKNIYVIIFAIIIGLALIATIVTYAIGNKDKALDNNNGNTDSNINSKDSEDRVDNTSNEELEYQIKNYHMDISNDLLYVDDYEKKYSDFSKKTEIEGLGYYIENRKVYAKKDANGELINVNINNEIPKYLEVGQDCGGIYVYILTEEGNVYGGFSYEPENIGLIYNKKDAKEIVRVYESPIFTTCGANSLYILANDKLYFTNALNHVQLDDKNNNYSTRESVHPYSIAYTLGTKDVIKSNSANYNSEAKILLYPDGTLNKYIYTDLLNGYDNKIENEFAVDEDGNKLKVSFIYTFNEKVYIISTNGHIYQFDPINDYVGDKLETFTLINVNKNKSVVSLELEVEYADYSFRYSVSKIFRNPKIKIIYDDKSVDEFSNKNGNSLIASPSDTIWH